MDAKTATLISAIENGTRHMRIDATHIESPPLDPKKPWKPHCSAMFRETMRHCARKECAYQLLILTRMQMRMNSEKE